MEKMQVRRSLRELDVIVAEKVMEWTGLTPADFNDWMPVGCPLGWENCAPRTVPSYSQSMDAAWGVVDRLQRFPHYRYVSVRTAPIGDIRQPVCVLVEWWSDNEKCPLHQHTEAPTAPIAICLAALKTIGIEVELTL